MYDYMIGKGIIVTAKIFIEVFAGEIKEHADNEEDNIYVPDLVQILVKKHFGEEFDGYVLGHDAFDARHGTVFELLMEMDEYKETCEQILDIDDVDSDQEKEDDKPFSPIHEFSGKYIFIGISESVLDPNVQLSWYVKGPEILYSLPAALKTMVKFYMTHSEKDIEFPTKIHQLFGNQKPLIWTFHIDCTECCG